MRRLSLSPRSCASRPRWRSILSAVCHVRRITSPTRPIAWASELIMLSAPRSCRMSSAAIVCARMRDSAKARSSAPAGAFGVVGVDGAAGDGGDGVLDKSGLVDGIRVDGHLHVVLVGDAQRTVDGRGRGAPVLVQLETDGAGLDLGGQAIRARAIA